MSCLLSIVVIRFLYKSEFILYPFLTGVSVAPECFCGILILDGDAISMNIIFACDLSGYHVRIRGWDRVWPLRCRWCSIGVGVAG